MLLHYARFMCHKVIDFGRTDFFSDLWNTHDQATQVWIHKANSDTSTEVPKSFNSVNSWFTGNPEKRATVSKSAGNRMQLLRNRKPQ